MTATTLSCRVQYLDDTDPFSSTSNFPEPIRPECYTFYTNVLLENQIITLKGFLKAPHKIEEAALQLYWNNGAQSDFGIYLDLDSTLDEQAEELEGFVENKKNAIILRTQLSIRVHTCTERLLSLNGRDLRKALFALKQIFQDDKDLVHAFVTNEGLDCLIRVGSDGDQSEQNYILKALGQVMLYVDGMNGVMSHNQTIQWLYRLLQSKTSLVVKTSLKLLILFVEYAETNTSLVLQAIRTVGAEQGTKPWSNIMAVLKDTNRGDLELLVYAMTLVNKMLNAIPDQDVFYDATDAMEEQGMASIIEHFMSKPGLDEDLLEQFKLYEAVLSHEDGEGELDLFSRMDSIRKTPRIKTDSRKSRRRSEAPVGTFLSSAQSLSSLSNLAVEPEPSDMIRRGNIIDNSALLATSLKEPSFFPSGRDNIATKTDADIGDNSAKGILNRKQRRIRQKSQIYDQNQIIKSASMTNLADDTQSPPLSPRVTTTYDDNYTPGEHHLLPYGLDNNKNQVKPSDSGNKSIFPFLGQQKYRFGSPDLLSNRAVAPAVGVRESRELYGSYHPSAESGPRVFETEHGRHVEPSSTFGEWYPEYAGDFRSRSENPARAEERRISDSVYVKEPVVTFAEPVRSDYSISRDTLLDGPERMFPPAIPYSRDFPDPYQSEELGYHGPSSAVVENDHVENGESRRDLDDLLSQYRLSHSFDAADAAERDGEMERGRNVADLTSRLMYNSMQPWAPYPKDQVDISGPSRLPALPEDSERMPGADGFTAEIMGGRANLRPWTSSAAAPVVVKKQPDVVVDEKTDLNWEKIRRSAKDRPLMIRDLDFTNLTEHDDVDYLGVQAVATSRHPILGTPRYFPHIPSIVPPPPPPPMMGIPPPPSIGGIPPPPPPPINIPPSPQPSAGNSDASKKSKKTMKLHWKEAKVEFLTPAGRNLETIWTKLSREVGHVGLNTTQLEHLFELKSQDGKGKDVVSQKQDGSRKELTILDTKRSNAINIGRTSLPGSTDTIKTAIMNMDTSILNREAIEKLLTTMMPTDEEKAKIFAVLSSNSDDIPLGTAEQFLLAMGSIPELYSRLKLWLFKLDYEVNEREISEPLADLMNGIEELRKNATFKYILATLLSIGNFLNGSEANGFTIEYLSRVPDVKDTVHKHTLLHHLVNYVLDKFQDGSDLYTEVGAISRCAKLDWDELEEKLKNLEIDCKASWNHLNIISKHDLPITLKNKLTEFLMECSAGIVLLQTVYARVMNRYAKFLLYLGYSADAIREDKVHLFCKTISEFALEYRTTREKVIQMREKKANQRERKKTRGKLILDSMNSTKMLASKSKPVQPVIEEEEGDDLNKILQNGSGIFKSRKRVSTESTAKSTAVAKKESAPDGFDTAEDELLESVLRNASATPAEQKPRERRRRARNTDRRSLRRTLKSGLTTEEVAVVNSKRL